MSQPWNVIGIFCDDIREEKSGQTTVIGIMPDNMSVPQLPGALPKLGVYVRCHIDPNADVGAISLKLRFPDGEESVLNAFDEAAVKKIQAETKAKGTPVAGFLLMAVMGMVQLPAPGRLLALVTIGGEDVVAGSINFELAQQATADANASQQPS